MKIIDALSPHHNDRAAGTSIQHLILHYTGMESLRHWVEEALDIGVSAHYVIDEDGTVYRIVPEEKRAWHAGKSFWEGETDINSTSIGIELQNPGHELGLRSFMDKQLDALVALCHGIIKRHNILPRHVLAHSDIAVGRKKDPGEMFPWPWLAEQGVGFWPAQMEDDPGGDIKALLHAYGYGPPSLDEKELVMAFQRHFLPGLYTHEPDRVGLADAQTRGQLAALLKHKQQMS